MRLEGPVSLLVVAVKAYDLDEALGRVEPSALRGRRRPPAPQRPRARRADPRLRRALARRRARPSSPARSGGSRRTRRSPASSCSARRARSSRPRATRSTPRVSTLRSGRCACRASTSSSRPASARCSGRRRRACAVLAAATVASGLTVGALRTDPAWRDASRARRSTRRARWRTPTASGSTRPVNGRSSTPCPRDLTTSTARDARAGRPTELDAITGSVVRAGAAARRPDPRARGAPRGGAMPSAVALIGASSGLGARAGQERPAARRAPAARLRDRDRAPERGLRPDRRLHRQRGDREGRALVRRRRAVPPARRSTRPRPRPTSTGSPGRCRGSTSTSTCSRSSAPPTRFAGPDVVRRGLEQLLATPEADSIRAVELVKQHPGKMWVLDEVGRLMRPLLDQSHLDVAWHAGQYQALPPVYVQNSALEIAWTRVVDGDGHA